MADFQIVEPEGWSAGESAQIIEPEGWDSPAMESAQVIEPEAITGVRSCNPANTLFPG